MPLLVSQLFLLCGFDGGLGHGCGCVLLSHHAHEGGLHRLGSLGVHTTLVLELSRQHVALDDGAAERVNQTGNAEIVRFDGVFVVHLPLDGEELRDEGQVLRVPRYAHRLQLLAHHTTNNGGCESVLCGLDASEYGEECVGHTVGVLARQLLIHILDDQLRQWGFVARGRPAAGHAERVANQVTGSRLLRHAECHGFQHRIDVIDVQKRTHTQLVGEVALHVEC
mmetsp:Transcript_41961/g.104765  ORF Transcript_41961/g.104765 Transcript_41961/m.104765 type:complete len:224 (+) Transcript_41961:888-1559(+)